MKVRQIQKGVLIEIQEDGTIKNTPIYATTVVEDRWRIFAKDWILYAYIFGVSVQAIVLFLAVQKSHIIVDTICLTANCYFLFQRCKYLWYK